MTDVLSHVRDGVNEARRLFADQKLRVDRSMAAGEDARAICFSMIDRRANKRAAS
jgi:hypothetical protein